MTSILTTLDSISAPCLCLDIDIADPIPDIDPHSGDSPIQCASLLVRLHGEPLGFLYLKIPSGGIVAATLCELIATSLRQEISVRIEHSTDGWDGKVHPSGLLPGEPSLFLEQRRAAVADPPSITAVVCTRNRPTGLRECLESLIVQSHPRFTILVIDNAPSSDEAMQVVATYPRSLVSYVM